VIESPKSSIEDDIKKILSSYSKLTKRPVSNLEDDITKAVKNFSQLSSKNEGQASDSDDPQKKENSLDASDASYLCKPVALHTDCVVNNDLPSLRR
jgi:hypothetical protein